MCYISWSIHNKWRYKMIILWIAMTLDSTSLIHKMKWNVTNERTICWLPTCSLRFVPTLMSFYFIVDRFIFSFSPGNQLQYRRATKNSFWNSFLSFCFTFAVEMRVAKERRRLRDNYGKCGDRHFVLLRTNTPNTKAKAKISSTTVKVHAFVRRQTSNWKNIISQTLMTSIE